MEILGKGCLTCRGRAYPLKSMLQKQKTIIGVLWQIQGKEGEETELYMLTSHIHLTSHWKTPLFTNLLGFLNKFFWTETVWTRKGLPCGREQRLPLRRYEILQTNFPREKEKVGALPAQKQTGRKLQPGTYHCSSCSIAALVTVSDNKMWMECALMLNHCSCLYKRHLSCVSYWKISGS